MNAKELHMYVKDNDELKNGLQHVAITASEVVVQEMTKKKNGEEYDEHTLAYHLGIMNVLNEIRLGLETDGLSMDNNETIR